MASLIKNYLEKVEVGGKQTYKNMVMYPVLSGYSTDIDYILLDEAFSEGVIEVKEVDIEGDVNRLRVVNNSSRMILILDGEELVGAKQNRIVNTTVLVKGHKSIIIPVSCVEMGRWHYNSTNFRSEKRIMPSAIRAKKARQVVDSLRSDGMYEADQSAIWDDISDQASRRSAESGSMAMAEIYEKDKASIEEYVKHFKIVENQVGAIFIINGIVAGLDCFGKSKSFSDVFSKLVQSYALDAVDWLNPEAEYKVSKKSADRFLSTLEESKVETRTAAGIGTDIRLDSDQITGFALEFNEELLHFCAFPAESTKTSDYKGSRMARPSRRMRNRS